MTNISRLGAVSASLVPAIKAAKEIEKEILGLEGVERSQRLGKIMQNIKLCRKFKVKIVSGSFAKNEDELRNFLDINKKIRK